MKNIKEGTTTDGGIEHMGAKILNDLGIRGKKKHST